MLIKTLCHRVLIIEIFTCITKFFQECITVKKIEYLRKCSVTSKLAISEYLIKIRNVYHPSAGDIFWVWENHLPNMKVLKTIYIKSRQPFLCKQKKWLLGHSIICLEIIVSQYVVDTFVFSFFMFSFVVSVHNIPISSVEFWQVMSDNRLAHSLHFCNFFLFQCSCSFHLFLFISFLFN